MELLVYLQKKTAMNPNSVDKKILEHITVDHMSVIGTIAYNGFYYWMYDGNEYRDYVVCIKHDNILFFILNDRTFLTDDIITQVFSLQEIIEAILHIYFSYSPKL